MVFCSISLDSILQNESNFEVSRSINVSSVYNSFVSFKYVFCLFQIFEFWNCKVFYNLIKQI